MIEYGTDVAEPRRVLEGIEHLYSVDLLCDEPLQRFYRRFGLVPVPGMGLRNPAANRGGAGR